MAVRHTLEYYEIARIQIDTAIELYEKNNFICAITLAGAGEGIVGEILLVDKNITILDELKDGISKRHNVLEKDAREALNLTRNGLKHYKDEFCDQDIDLELQARVLIMRSILNYISLRNKKTENMDRFVIKYKELSND